MKENKMKESKKKDDKLTAFVGLIKPEKLDGALTEIVDALTKYELSPYEVGIMLDFLKMAIVDDFKPGKIDLSYSGNDKFGTWKPGYR